MPTAPTLPTSEERRMLRDALRGFLAQAWPAETALAHAGDPARLDQLWRALAGQGIAALGSIPEEGYLREILIAAEELGRAACPAPLLGAAIANLALGHCDQASKLLAALQEGEAFVSVSFGPFDGDASAGDIRLEGDRVSGVLRHVEGMEAATHLIVLDRAGSMLVIEASQTSVTPTPGYAIPPLSTLTLTQAPAMAIDLPAGLAPDLARIGQMIVTARALGATQRSFEQVVEYAKDRHQFGQPIGKFQAIQHKLATAATQLEAVRHGLGMAAAAHDHGRPDWRLFATASFAFASPALRQVSLETHHTYGAIGYSEDHEAPRHFRRVHADMARFGGPIRAREELAARLLDAGESLPDYSYGATADAFRTEVRDWLDTHWNAQRRATHRAKSWLERVYDKDFQKELGKQGWIGISWPEEFGGQARSPLEQLVYMEELERAGVPSIGASLQAPALMKFGTPQQQQDYIPRIRGGEISFSLGYSEPGSGSDFASLQTSAVRDGDDWVINGQKIWNSGAVYSDYVWLAARTDPGAKPKQAGIGVFIVPLDAQGLTVQPSMAMHGRTFSSLFFDNVRVSADALIGGPTDGWKILTSALADERMLMGGSVNRTRRVFGALVDFIRTAGTGDAPMARNGAVRDRIGQLAAEIEAARALLVNCVEMAQNGEMPVQEAAMSKCFSGELMERTGEVALDLLGMQATLAEGAPGEVLQGEIEQFLRHSIMFVIGGGTAEIQRNLIAQRGLGLPR